MKLILLAILSASCLASWAGAAEPACHDADKVYKVCSDQEESYRADLARAKEQDKMLVVVLGAEWCPWCMSLHHMLSDPAFGGEFAKKFVLGGVALYDGKKKVPSGESVLARLKAQARFDRKIEGIPVLAMVNPKSEKAVLIDTAPLEKNTKTKKGHDPKKVLAALETAAAKVR
jgi:hypothetical protein